MIYNIYRTLRFINNKTMNALTQLISLIIFRINNIEYDEGFTSNGIPSIFVQGLFKVGKNFKINNTINANPIGRSYKCMFIVRKGAQLLIGDNVGISGTTIVCQKKITIEDNVKIGGNVCIYDTDFHTLDAFERQDIQLDKSNMIKKEVIIEENVFIGAHSTILKGVSIGKNSIIGACSVVTKNIPANEIWAGNPARFIRKINDENIKNK